MKNGYPNLQETAMRFLLCFSTTLKKKLRGLSPQANYTDRATPLVVEVNASVI
jgi:hypothetical protein